MRKNSNTIGNDSNISERTTRQIYQLERLVGSIACALPLSNAAARASATLETIISLSQINFQTMYTIIRNLNECSICDSFPVPGERSCTSEIVQAIFLAEEILSDLPLDILILADVTELVENHE